MKMKNLDLSVRRDSISSNGSVKEVRDSISSNGSVKEVREIFEGPDSNGTIKRNYKKSSKTIVSDKPEKTPVAKNDCVVKSTDMSEELQKEVLEVAMLAMNKFRLEKDMATYIKEEFDRRHDPSWHCVVGKNFGSFVTHEINHFIYLYVQHIAIMLFKTGF